MTPIFIAPPELPPPPSVASAITVAGAGSIASAATISTTIYVSTVAASLEEADWPRGIDYETWAPVVQPAPRDVFADRLDIIDFFEDA